MDKSKIAEAPAGAAIVWTKGAYGHVGIVVQNDGKNLMVTEANWGPLETLLPEKWAIDNAISVRFNKHDENVLSYSSAADRGGYKLVGFVLPERVK